MKARSTLKGLALAAMLASPGAAMAEWAPDGPITLQIGFGAGGSTDTLGRAIATAIEENKGWDVIVENKPGGGGVAMFSGLVRDDADGQTLGMGVTMATLMNLATRGDSLPFQLDSFDYLATVVVAPVGIIAPADAPYNTFAELVEQSKAAGGYLVGFDAGPQKMILGAINKNSDAGFELVSHNSGAEMVQGILGGQLQAAFGTGEHIEYVKSGDLKMLAVVTEARQPFSPDTTSLGEQGFPYALEPFFYIAAPKGLDPEAKDALAAALDEAISSEVMNELIVNVMKTEAVNLGPDGTEEKLKNSLGLIQGLIESNK